MGQHIDQVEDSQNPLPGGARHMRNLSHGQQGVMRPGSPLHLEDQIIRVQSQVTITTAAGTTSDELSTLLQ